MENEIDVTDLDHVVDVTDTVKVYEKGKTVECECEHGIGTEKDTEILRCYSCGKLLIDRGVEDRGHGQQKLGQFG